jgi:hypothetical protein
MSKSIERVLKVGEAMKLKSTFMSSTGFLYSGLPNRETFSIVVTCTRGNNSMAYNLFFPLSQRQIDVGGKKIDLYHITPHEIRLAIANQP